MAGKSITAKKVYCICFLGLMMIPVIASVFLYFKNHPLTKRIDEQIESVSIPFSEQYPFEENQKRTDLGFIGQYQNFIKWLSDGTNQYLTTLNPFSIQFQKIPTNISGDIVFNGNNTFVKLSNGYLVGCFEYCPSSSAMNNVKDFSVWLKNRDIPFVALIQADKSDDSVTVFPAGVPHGYTKMMDEYKAFLDKNAVEYIDAKPILLAENNNLYSWFYKSDHHWNVRAGFTMARETAKYLKEELDIPSDTDILDTRNFITVVYSNSFLGSYGRKLGGAWKEDMEVLYPTIATDFHVVVPEKGIDKKGTFYDSLIDQRFLGNKYSSYSAFLGGDYSLIHIENKNNQNGKRVLVIKKSFGNVFCPYLACTCQYLDVISLLSFDGSIRSYIKQTKPDAVILCMGVVTKYDEDQLHLN